MCIVPSQPIIAMVPHAPQALPFCVFERTSSCSDISVLHFERRCREVDGAVAARRCAESFRKRRRADNSEEDMCAASSPFVEGVDQNYAFCEGWCDKEIGFAGKKCQARLKKLSWLRRN